MIKKITALLLTLMMLGALVSAQAADFTGTWYLVSIDSNGVTINPADMGMEMSLNLNADGTARFLLPTRKISRQFGRWTAIR